MDLSTSFSMMFTMPILEENYEATAAIILESYSAMSGEYIGDGPFLCTYFKGWVGYQKLAVQISYPKLNMYT